MPACFSQLIVVLPTYQTVEVLLSPPCQGHLSGANAHAMPTQCPRNAHAIPTQCTATTKSPIGIPGMGPCCI
jgi:hypothetical protein